MFVFLVLFAGLWSESVFLNWLFSLLFIVSAFIGMLVFANFMSRCHFYLLLAEFPSMPCGIRIPVYFVNQAGHRYQDDVFENMNKEEVFIHCSAKRIVLTNKGLNSGAWLIPGISFFVLLSVSFSGEGNFWTSDTCVGAPLCLVCFLAAVFCIFTTEKKYLSSTGRVRRSLYLRFRVSVKARPSPGRRLLWRFVRAS